MKALLDTHVLLWARIDDPRLSPTARDAFLEGRNTLLWSAASSWELAIKFGLGKLTLPEPPHRYVPRVLREFALHGLAIEHSHALRVATLPDAHRDPFDRLLVAQAQLEKVPILSSDRRLDAYDVERLW